MTPERWQQVKGVLHQVLELVPEERSAFLDQACSADHSLRRDVESVLSSSDQDPSGFLKTGAARVTLRAGTKLGEYEVESLLGSGGMGEVYRARDLRLGRDVAIKVLPQFFASDRARLRRFEQEARAAAALNHPNILAVYQMGVYDEAPYLVSELLDGETLRTRLKRGPLPVSESVDCALQIARGLAAAHEKGIVHRDLKPENLFVTKGGHVKILDFGLAKQTQTPSIPTATRTPLATEPGVVLGTVGYMSPEQVRGQSADHRSDIFAFGAILYEMLSGKRAFHGESSADTMSAILKEDPPRLSKSTAGIPRELEGVVRRCLEKNAEQRFQSAEELLAALREVESLPAVSVAVFRWLTLHWRAAVTAMVLLVLIAVGIWTAVRRLPNHESSKDSIAVMPFANNNPGADGEALGDGITTGLIESLSQVPHLKVMSRGAVFHYKGHEIDPRAIGRELNVRAVLLGKIEPRGDSFVVDTELVNASDSSHIWGEQYKLRPSEVLTLQAELAQTVSDKLGLRLSGNEKARISKQGTSNPEAYSLYVKGRFFLDRWDPEDCKKGLALFQQAVEKDPAYAQAYAGMGDAYTIVSFMHGLAFEEGIQKAKSAAYRALELDENLAEAHAALAGAFYVHWEWQDAGREIRRAVELNPNLSLAHQYYSLYLETTGNMEQGLAEQKRALELDPLSYMGNKWLGYTYYEMRDYDRAIEQFLKTMDLASGDTETIGFLADTYGAKGDYGKALLEYQRILKLKGKDKQAEVLAREYATGGYHGLLRAEIAVLSDPKNPDDYDPVNVAFYFSVLNDRDNAFYWLDRAYKENGTAGSGLLPILIEPELDNIRPDPRYKAFVRRMGLEQ
jgi:serine/threonine protein kinase/tetratricopeptide (TPR) repeat protein